MLLITVDESINFVSKTMCDSMEDAFKLAMDQVTAASEDTASIASSSDLRNR